MSSRHSESMKLRWLNPEYRARQSEARSQMAKRRRGSLNGHFSHGMTQTPEYRAYSHAKYRCTKSSYPKWSDYGGRGIEFRFTSFEQFLAEVGPRPAGMSLERINNDGHYEPGNVRWATNKEQVSNRRKANSNCRSCGRTLRCNCTEPEYGISGC